MSDGGGENDRQVRSLILLSPPPLSPGKRAVVGYEDGTVRVWDLKQGNAIHVVKGESSFASVGASFHVRALTPLPSFPSEQVRTDTRGRSPAWRATKTAPWC